MYKAGDVVWANFPFDNSSQAKYRPVLVISGMLVNNTQDCLLMQITSVSRSDGLSLAIADQDFLLQPLSKQSFLRLHKIFFLNQNLISRKETSVTPIFLQKVVQQLLLLLG